MKRFIGFSLFGLMLFYGCGTNNQPSNHSRNWYIKQIKDCGLSIEYRQQKWQEMIKIYRIEIEEEN